MASSMLYTHLTTWRRRTIRNLARLRLELPVSPVPLHMRCTTDFLVRSAPEDCPAVRHSLSGQTRFRGLPFFSCGAALTFRPEVYQTKVPCPAAGRYTRSARRSQPFREVANASPVRRPKGSHFYSRPRPQDDQLFGRHPMRTPPPQKKKSQPPPGLG